MKEINILLQRYPELSVCRESIEQAFQLWKKAFAGGGKLLVCGNGGSAADAEHIVGELMKGFMYRRPLSQRQKEKLSDAFPERGEALAEHLQGALPAISLVSHSALMTAFSNDVAPEMVFAQQVFGYGVPGDVLVGLSTSGDSQNVVNAMLVAKAFGLTTVALTGENGGELKEIADVTIAVPRTSTPEVQELHLPVYHAICKMVESEFFDE